MFAQYEHATPPTGKIAREIEKTSDEGNLMEVQQLDCAKPRTRIATNFNDKVEERNQVGHVVATHTPSINQAVLHAFTQ